MNSNEVSVSKANSLVSWLSRTAKKISAVFATKKETLAVDKKLAEAIACIEWRTRYDQQRIVRYIYTASFQKENSELYTALDMSLPVKHFWSDEKINIEITDNSFERKLVRWFGELNPATKQLIDGKPTQNQRWVKKNVRITELYLNRFPMHGTATSLSRYEQQMLNALIASATTVHISTAPALLLPGTVTDSVQSKEKIEAAAIEVVAETLHIEKVASVTEIQATEHSTLVECSVDRRSLSKKMTIKELKAYAKTHKIHVPGRKTKHRDIYEHIKSQLS